MNINPNLDKVSGNYEGEKVIRIYNERILKTDKRFYELMSYFDKNLNKRVVTTVKINDTKMKIKIALPEDLKGFSKYEVVYILDGEIKETIEAKVENGYIVFETSHLSHYGIVAIEENNNIVNPKTNDDIVMYFISSIISLVGVTGVLIYYRKKQN